MRDPRGRGVETCLPGQNRPKDDGLVVKRAGYEGLADSSFFRAALVAF